MTLPFARRWAVDLDLTHFWTDREKGDLRFGGERTLFAPALQFRGGGQRSHGSRAFGEGAGASGTPSGRGGSRLSCHGIGLTLSARTGFLAAVTSRRLFRADVFQAIGDAAPGSGVRANGRRF